MRVGNLGPWGLVIFALYVLVILLISWGARRLRPTSNEFLNASRSLATWVVALSFLAYNCGSIEVVGMSAMAAQYGVQAFHFYWIGGIPGLIFMGVVVLPVYIRTGARSLPEYLGMRFGARVRLLDACISMAGTAGSAGVVLYAMAQVLYVVLGWSLLTGALISAVVVLAYVLLGGIRATIFTSVFQLFVMIAGLAPLLFLTVHFNAASFAARTERWHLWKPLPFVSPHATLDRFGVALGLGFVISFSYWCTDFVMIQRALTARSVDAARKVPLLAGFGKMAFAMMIVLPGVAAPALLRGTQGLSFDETMPALMSLAFGPALLALGSAALLAGLMAGLAGNVSGFSAVWTEEVYRTRIHPDRTEQHYIGIGRASAVGCILLAQLAAYATFSFHDLMEFLQLIVALFYAPVFAGVLAGVVSERTTERGAFGGIVLGVLSAGALQIICWAGYLHFGTQMNLNFYAAMLSFSVAMLGSLFYGRQKNESKEIVQKGLAPSRNVLDAIGLTPDLAVLSVALLTICVLLNVLWW
jgi:solute:Na+ symporter, SSS family